MYPNRFVTKKTAPMKCIREFLRSPKPLGRVVDQLARARRGPETRSREAKDEVLSEWSSALAANLCPPACAYLGFMFRGVTANRAQGTISNELRFFFSYFPTRLTLKILAGSGDLSF